MSWTMGWPQGRGVYPDGLWRGTGKLAMVDGSHLRLLDLPAVHSVSAYLDEADAVVGRAGGTHGRGGPVPYRGDAGGGGAGGLWGLTPGQDLSLGRIFRCRWTFTGNHPGLGGGQPGEADRFTAYARDQARTEVLRVTPRTGGVSGRLQPGRTAHPAGAGDH